MTLPTFPSNAELVNTSMHPDYFKIREWQDQLSRMPNFELQSGIIELQRENAKLREANESVAVCSEHIERVTYTEEVPCLVCALDDGFTLTPELHERLKAMQLKVSVHLGALMGLLSAYVIHGDGENPFYEDQLKLLKEDLPAFLTLGDELGMPSCSFHRQPH